MRRFGKPDGPLRNALARGGKNLSALADLSGKWIDRVHGRRPPKGILLEVFADLLRLIAELRPLVTSTA
jgi:hypothetical protein